MRCKAASHTGAFQDLPRVNRLLDALEPQGPEVFTAEHSRHESFRGVTHDHRPGLRGALETGGDVQRGAQRLLVAPLIAPELPHDDGSCVDTDSYGERGQGVPGLRRLLRIGRAERPHDLQTGAHGAFCIVLVRLRVPEVGAHAITGIELDMAAPPHDHVGHRPSIRAHDFMQPLLFVEEPGEWRVLDDVAEQGGELAPFAGLRCGRLECGSASVAESRVRAVLTPALGAGHRA